MAVPEATPDGKPEAHAAAANAARASYGRLVAIVASRSGSIADAEDALGEAFARALTAWPREGVPRNPEAWLVTVARNRLIDTARSAAARTAAGPADDEPCRTSSPFSTASIRTPFPKSAWNCCLPAPIRRSMRRCTRR